MQQNSSNILVLFCFLRIRFSTLGLTYFRVTKGRVTFFEISLIWWGIFADFHYSLLRTALWCFLLHFIHYHFSSIQQHHLLMALWPENSSFPKFFVCFMLNFQLHSMQSTDLRAWNSKKSLWELIYFNLFSEFMKCMLYTVKVGVCVQSFSKKSIV